MSESHADQIASTLEEAVPPRGEPHSAFSKRRKRYIIVLVAIAAVFSPLSSFIYYPAIQTLAGDLRVSIEKINLGITTYMVVSGVTPAFVGDLADQIGRRPVYLTTLGIYLLANVGLALQSNYAALLVLRALQSAGSSGTIAIAYGVISDVATPAERGSYVGAFQIGPNVAPSFGPVIGAVLADLAGWRWIFWFLAICSGFVLCLLFLFLPETARKIVGNGAVSSKSILATKRFGRSESQPTATPGVSSRRRLHVPNPLKSLRILFEKDSAIIILTNGIFYMTYCCVQASLSSLFIELYGLTSLQAGLVYLPFGVGCAIGSYTFGKVMTRDYMLVAKAAGVEVDASVVDDLSKLHIELARLRSFWWVAAISLGCLLGYGWSLHAKITMAVPLVLQFFIGFMITGVFNMCMTLLVDVHPLAPATSQASLNIVRCSLAAGGIAVLQILIDAVGVGWCFTVVTVICLSTIPLVWAEIKWGPKWRESRATVEQKHSDESQSPVMADKTKA